MSRSVMARCSFYLVRFSAVFFLMLASFTHAEIPQAIHLLGPNEKFSPQIRLLDSTEPQSELPEDVRCAPTEFAADSFGYCQSCDCSVSACRDGCAKYR